jgi:hypothetical protein
MKGWVYVPSPALQLVPDGTPIAQQATMMAGAGSWQCLGCGSVVKKPQPPAKCGRCR